MPTHARHYGTHALLVTGAYSLQQSPNWPALTAALAAQGMSWHHIAITGEPSPAMVDAAVQDLRAETIDVVIGIGGGSALDAAKAMAGLLKPGNSVMDHLEGVGPDLPYTGPATPLYCGADDGGYRLGSHQKRCAEHAGRERVQEIVSGRQTGRRGCGGRPRSAGNLSCRRGCRQRHGYAYPVAGVLCFESRCAMDRFARLGRNESSARGIATFAISPLLASLPTT